MGGGKGAVEGVLKCVIVQPPSALDLHTPSAMLPVQTNFRSITAGSNQILGII
jgi:hypothetical protein